MLRVKTAEKHGKHCFSKIVEKLIYVYIDNHTKNVEGIKNSLPTFCFLMTKSLSAKTAI